MVAGLGSARGRAGPESTARRRALAPGPHLRPLTREIPLYSRFPCCAPSGAPPPAACFPVFICFSSPSPSLGGASPPLHRVVGGPELKLWGSRKEGTSGLGNAEVWLDSRTRDWVRVAQPWRAGACMGRGPEMEVLSLGTVRPVNSKHAGACWGLPALPAQRRGCGLYRLGNPVLGCAARDCKMLQVPLFLSRWGMGTAVLGKRSRY